MRYSTIVLYYRLGDAFAATLDALEAQTSRATRTYVVDNCSQDGVVARMRARGLSADVEVVSPTRNGGYAAGMNVGAAHARDDDSEYLLFLTHEVLLEPGCVEEMLRVAKDTRAAVIGPTLFTPDGGVWSSGATVDWRGGARHRRSNPSEPTDVDWLDGACLLVRAKDFHDCGGFDESYFLYWEDVDFCLTLGERGRIVIAPAASATQAPSANPPLYYVARNRLWLWRRRGEKLKTVLSVGELSIWAVLWVLRKRGRDAGRDLKEILRGVRDGLTSSPARAAAPR